MSQSVGYEHIVYMKLKFRLEGLGFLCDEKQLQLKDDFVRYRYRYKIVFIINISQWRRNERDGVSNQRGLDGLLNRLFRRR